MRAKAQRLNSPYRDDCANALAARASSRAYASGFQMSPRPRAFDGYAFDDDAFDCEFFQTLIQPLDRWAAVAVSNATWSSKAVAAESWTAPDNDDGL